MTLTAKEFLRRFLQHVLPRGFVRIRFFGFLSPRKRRELLPLCQQLLDTDPATTAQPSASGQSCIPATWTCPSCGGPMVVVERLDAGQLQKTKRDYFDTS